VEKQRIKEEETAQKRLEKEQMELEKQLKKEEKEALKRTKSAEKEQAKEQKRMEELKLKRFKKDERKQDKSQQNREMDFAIQNKRQEDNERLKQSSKIDITLDDSLPFFIGTTKLP
jgi:hypothetical protein